MSQNTPKNIRMKKGRLSVETPLLAFDSYSYINLFFR